MSWLYAAPAVLLPLCIRVHTACCLMWLLSESTQYYTCHVVLTSPEPFWRGAPNSSAKHISHCTTGTCIFDAVSNIVDHSVSEFVDLLQPCLTSLTLRGLIKETSVFLVASPSLLVPLLPLRVVVTHMHVWYTQKALDLTLSKHRFKRLSQQGTFKSACFCYNGT